MALPSAPLVALLRQTAQHLQDSPQYQWGHMGMCNCGHLAQVVTGLSAAEIHTSALVREGDWEEQARHYCPTSGMLIDHVLAALMQIGLDKGDIQNLEKLSDPAVLRALAPRTLRHNRRSDVVLYLRTWAGQIEESLQSRRKDATAALAEADPR